MGESGGKWKIDWGMASFVLAVTLAVLTFVKAYGAFNASTESQINSLRAEIAQSRSTHQRDIDMMRAEITILRAEIVSHRAQEVERRGVR